MNPRTLPLAEGATAEVSELIEKLHQTGRRLEDLTEGEVDTVTNRDGRTVTLRRAQDQMRHSEAARQTAILNALPANIALLDAAGVIVSVNEGWRGFAGANALLSPKFGIGLSYLEVCDRAQGDDAAVALQAAAGLRSVLAGAATTFSIEYPCHSPAERRWFQLLVTPLSRDRPGGAVVMHLDITPEKQANERLRVSDLQIRQMTDNIRDVFFLLDADGQRMLYISPAYETIWGRSCESLYANPISWTEAIHPDDRVSAHEIYKQGLSAGAFEFEYRIVRPDGSIRWIETRGFPIRDDAGRIIRITGVAKDITERTLASLKLRESEERLRTIIENEPDCVKVVSADGRLLEINKAGLVMIEADSFDQVRNMPLLDVVAPEHRAAFVQLLRGVFDGESGTLDFAIIGLKGTRRLLETHAAPLRDADGRVTALLGITRDVTERKETENKIRRLSRVYAVLSGINTLIVRARDRDELFREACQIAVEDGQFTMAWIGIVDRHAMTLAPVASAGTTPDVPTLIKQRFSLLEDAPLGNILSARAIREKKVFVSNDVQTDSRIVFKEDHAKRGSRSLAVLPLLGADDAIGVLALYAGEPGFFDAEEVKLLTELAGDIAYAIDHIEKQERLDYLAYYDPLTGLANRSLFLERVAQYMRSAADGGHKLAVFLIDLERFRNINESLGRPAGDALLKQVADWLTRTTGDAGLLARVGVDHFAVVLPKVREDGNVVRFLEKWRQAFLAHPFRLKDAVFRLAAKVGVAQFPDDGGDAETLFRNAEAALKKAKTSGHRYLFYTRTMTEALAGRLTMENQLRQALDNEEFVLHYQPKVNFASGKLTGAEALIRWNDPRTGLVPPGRFIPILEETGLIHDVGRWALRQAIADYLRWRAAGLPAMRIAVNVSALQLRSPGFIAEIGQAIGIDAQAAAGLELEVTESVIMEDTVHTISSLAAIRAMGLTIAIDDFGTGFSSLSYLARLPVDSLKIDRSFVNDMTASSEGLALVSTIISLAHALKLKVVAEGVETDEQSRLLRLLGCDEMQGFLYSKPLPAGIFETRFLAPPAAG
ncbi:MAG: EAL domain-containing protein [Betaproteobacteria bacterium]|nr:MAG: EAL domain-containing protein [Betaproteobacteria bacterium]